MGCNVSGDGDNGRGNVGGTTLDNADPRGEGKAGHDHGLLGRGLAGAVGFNAWEAAGDAGCDGCVSFSDCLMGVTDVLDMRRF